MADNPALQHKIISCQTQTFTSATTGTGIAIDARGYAFATFSLGLGTTTASSGTLAMKVQMDDNSSFTSASDVTGAAMTTFVVDDADNTTRILVVDLSRVSERYIRSHLTTAVSATSVPVNVTCILSNGPVQTLKTDYADYDANF